MKHIFLIIALLSFGITNEAMASCNHSNVVDQVSSFLRGKTVCATRGGEKWQEFHKGPRGVPDNLIDYKKGPSDPVDPSEPVGSWTADGNGHVIYDYGTGGTYKFSIHHSDTVPGAYDFCTTRSHRGATPEVAGAILLQGQVACP